jgi:hypothetical protein
MDIVISYVPIVVPDLLIGERITKIGGFSSMYGI